MEINFIFSKEPNETRTMHTKSDNIKIMIGNETGEIIKKLFELLLQKYQEGLEKLMKGSEFIFDFVDLLYYKLHKINLNRGKSYIDSPEWLKNKKATINLKNSDNKCSQYALAVALNQEKINNHPERISNVKPFTNQYNWKEIEFSSHKNDWKNFESYNKTIALNILYVPKNSEEIRHAYKLKYNLNRKNQVIILMITDGKKWRYLAVKNLNALLRRITSTKNGVFYCLNCLHSFKIENKLKERENVCKNNDYRFIEIPKEDNNPFIIYSNLESLLEKMSTCHNKSHQQLK